MGAGADAARPGAPAQRWPLSEMQEEDAFQEKDAFRQGVF